MTTSSYVEDIMEGVGLDDSEYESSGDEYVPSAYETDSDEEQPCRPTLAKGSRRG